MNPCIEREGVVTAIQNDFMVIEVASASGCGRCDQPGGCGKANTKPRRYALPHTLAAQVGDKVIVSLAEGALFKAALWAYLAPLGLLFVGAGIGQALGGANGSGGPAIAGAFSGLAIGFILLRRLSRRAAPQRASPLAVRLKAAY